MARWETAQGRALRPTPKDLDRLQRAVAGLRRWIALHRQSLVAAQGTRHVSFIERALDNLSGFGATLLDRDRADRTNNALPGVEGENRREVLNAKNVRWLVEQEYPGRKLIIWAHNAHVMNAYYGPDWSSVALEPRPNWMKPTGIALAEQFGHDLYTIGITAFAGEDGFAAALPATPVAPASPASIEAELHSLGFPYAFIDMRSARETANPIRQSQLMRLPKYEEERVNDPTRPYDGLLFIDRMARANRLPQASMQPT